MSDRGQIPYPVDAEAGQNQDSPNHTRGPRYTPSSSHAAYKLVSGPQLLGGVTGKDAESLNEEDRFLVYLRQEENLAWKDIEIRFQQERGRCVQSVTLALRYKRLCEKFRRWEEQDVHALQLAHEFWAKNKWQIISCKMLDFSVQGQWPARYCSRKWQEMEVNGRSADDIAQHSLTSQGNGPEGLDDQHLILRHRVHQLEAEYKQTKEHLALVQEQKYRLEGERDYFCCLLAELTDSMTGCPQPERRPHWQDETLLSRFKESKELSWEQISEFYPGPKWDLRRAAFYALIRRVSDNGRDDIVGIGDAQRAALHAFSRGTGSAGQDEVVRFNSQVKEFPVQPLGCKSPGITDTMKPDRSTSRNGSVEANAIHQKWAIVSGDRFLRRTDETRLGGDQESSVFLEKAGHGDCGQQRLRPDSSVRKSNDSKYNVLSRSYQGQNTSLMRGTSTWIRRSSTASSSLYISWVVVSRSR